MWPMKVIGALLVIAEFFKCQMRGAPQKFL